MDDNEGWIVGVLVIGVAVLSYFVPGWVAGAIGLTPEHAALVASWKTWEPWFKWPAFIGYGLAGFTVVAGVFAGVIAVIAAVSLGFFRAGKAVFHTLRRLINRCFSLLGTGITLFFWLLFWPVRAAFEWVWEEIEDRYPDLRLRRIYRMDRAIQEEFGSYRTFRDHWYQHSDHDAYEEDEEWGDAGSDGQEAAAGPDSDLVRAMGILYLTEPFTEADVEKRFKALMKHLHSDAGGSDDFGKELNWARATIKERMDLA